jgi:FrmR/RcnR family transcriptional regulator, repressor of frmRAB operon
MGSRPLSQRDEEKSKLLKRLTRIRGQIEALRRAVDENAATSVVLQQATACRGAIESFMAEVIEDHIRERLVEAKTEAAAAAAAEELIEIVHSYLT